MPKMTFEAKLSMYRAICEEIRKLRAQQPEKIPALTRRADKRWEDIVLAIANGLRGCGHGRQSWAKRMGLVGQAVRDHDSVQAVVGQTARKNRPSQKRKIVRKSSRKIARQ
jgi:hypothetical protein